MITAKAATGGNNKMIEKLYKMPVYLLKPEYHFSTSNNFLRI